MNKYRNVIESHLRVAQNAAASVLKDDENPGTRMNMEAYAITLEVVRRVSDEVLDEVSKQVLDKLYTAERRAAERAKKVLGQRHGLLDSPKVRQARRVVKKKSKRPTKKVKRKR